MHIYADHDFYSKIVTTYEEHPYGLKYMHRIIGSNQSVGNEWVWFDGTPYNCSKCGTNTSVWSNAVTSKKFSLCWTK